MSIHNKKDFGHVECAQLVGPTPLEGNLVSFATGESEQQILGALTLVQNSGSVPTLNGPSPT